MPTLKKIRKIQYSPIYCYIIKLIKQWKSRVLDNGTIMNDSKAYYASSNDLKILSFWSVNVEIKTFWALNDVLE